MEAAQGISNALPKDTSVLGGLNEATYLAQQAKQHDFNVMRLFGIADVNYNEGMPLQPSPGVSTLSQHISVDLSHYTENREVSVLGLYRWQTWTTAMPAPSLIVQFGILE